MYIILSLNLYFLKIVKDAGKSNIAYNYHSNLEMMFGSRVLEELKTLR